MTLTANEEVLDAIVERHIRYIQFATGIANRNAPILLKTEEELRDIIFSYYSRLQEVPLYTRRGQRLLKRMEEKILELRGGAWREIYTNIKDDLVQMAGLEAKAIQTSMQAAVPVSLGLTAPPTGVLAAVVVSQPFEGKTLKQWINTTGSADINLITTAVKNGITDGLTAKDVVNNILGTGKAKHPRNAQIRKAQHNMLSTVLTATSSVSNQARQAFYATNSDVIKQEVFTAVLDGRTTYECAGHDGDLHPIGKGPMPPLHFRCRSVRVPYLNPDNLGEKPMVPIVERELLEEYTENEGLRLVRSRGALPYGHKTKFDKYSRGRVREMIGNVPQDVDFDTFLRRRSKTFQDEYLGPARAKMYRDNPDMTVGDFTTVDGRTLTLDQLSKYN